MARAPYGAELGYGHRRTVAYGDDEGSVFLGEELSRTRQYGEATARELDNVRAALDRAFERATAILREQRSGVDRVVEALLEREEIGREVMEMIDGAEAGDGETAAA